MTTPASPAPGGGAAPAKAQQGAQPAGAQAPPSVLVQTPASDEPGRDGLSPNEERQLGELLDKRDRSVPGGTVRLKVTSGHESVSYGGLTVGKDFTDVPEHLVAGLTEGAAVAGVEITQDQES
jgi:hypothetical protein